MARPKLLVVGGGLGGMSLVSLLDGGFDVTLLESKEKLGGLVSHGWPSVWIPSQEPSFVSQVLGIAQENGVKLDGEEVSRLFQDINLAMKEYKDRKVIHKLNLMKYDSYFLDRNFASYGHSFPRIFELLIHFLITLMIFFYKFFRTGKEAEQKQLAIAYGNTRSLTSQFQSVVRSKPNTRILLSTQFTSMTPSENGYLVSYSQAGASVSEYFDYVVFANGGYLSSPTIMSRVFGEHHPVPHGFTTHGSENVLHCCEKLGAQISWEPHGWFAESMDFNEALNIPDAPPRTLLAGTLCGDSMIVVNSHGLRVYNEKLSYHKRGQVTLREKKLIMICDRRCLDTFNRRLFVPPNPCQSWFASPPERAKFVSANSPSQLAIEIEKGLGMRLDPKFVQNLESELQMFKSVCENGLKDKFQRGDTYADKFWQIIEAPDNHYQNKTMFPLNEQELYAAVLHPSLLDSCFGLKVDEEGSRLLMQDGTPSPNLFGVGNGTSNPLRGFYFSPGVPSALAYTQAFRAARHLNKVLHEKWQ